MHHEVVGGDGRRTELKCWGPWFREVGRTRQAFAKAMGFDPLINETASMGVLAAAATKAGMLALTEYVCQKRDANDGRRFRNGRADLWVHHKDKGLSWAFEAKQVRCTPRMRLQTLRARLDEARRDAADIPYWEARRRLGMLILTLPPGDISEITHQAIDTLVDTSFAAFRIDGGDPSSLIVIDKAYRPRKPRPKRTEP